MCEVSAAVGNDSAEVQHGYGRFAYHVPAQSIMLDVLMTSLDTRESEHAMHTDKGSATTAGTDFIPAELDLLNSPVTIVLGDHTDDAGLCAVCGSAWPCDRVQLFDYFPSS